MQEEPLTRACSRVRNRMEAVIEAKGGFIERMETKGSEEHVWKVSFRCVNIIVQKHRFWFHLTFVLKYLPHPVFGRL